MSTMVSEVYDALLEAGASSDKARSAAEAMASLQNRFPETYQKSSGEFRALKLDLTGLRGELTLLKWMMGFLLAGVAALIAKAFF